MLRTTISGQGPGPWLPWKRLKNSLPRRQPPVNSVRLPRVNRAPSPVRPVPKSLIRGRYTTINADLLSKSLAPSRGLSSEEPMDHSYETTKRTFSPRQFLRRNRGKTRQVAVRNRTAESIEELSQWKAN